MNQITRVRIKNYKSLYDVDVELGALNILAGRNGSGKTNFLDALDFVSTALRQGLYTAGNQSLWATVLEDDIQIEIDFRINNLEYSYVVGLSQLGFARNRLTYERFIAEKQIVFERNQDTWLISNEVSIAMPDNNLVLPLISGSPIIKQCYEFLTDIYLYDIAPKIIKNYAHSRANPDEKLDKYGSKLTFLLSHYLTNSPRAEEFKSVLLQVVPFVDDIIVNSNPENPEIKFVIGDTQSSIIQESDGTLRMMGILLALYQDPSPAVIAIEEPEQTIHPGALAILSDEIKEAANRSQIIITTHSPDLISHFDTNDLRIVERTKKGTKIGILKESQRKAVEQELFGMDELIRIHGELNRQPSE